MKQENEAELNLYLQVFEVVGNLGLETHRQRANEIIQALKEIKQRYEELISVVDDTQQTNLQTFAQMPTSTKMCIF